MVTAIPGSSVCGLLVERSAVDFAGLAKALASETEDGGAVEQAVDGRDCLAVGGKEAGPA
jgi:hypothetical protein